MNNMKETHVNANYNLYKLFSSMVCYLVNYAKHVNGRKNTSLTSVKKIILSCLLQFFACIFLLYIVLIFGTYLVPMHKI